MLIHPTLRKAFHHRCANIFAGHKRRARELRQELDYTAADLRGLAEAADQCGYCDAMLTVDTFTFDHDVPTARRADFGCANLCVCCTSCNLVKGAMSGDEYRALLGVVGTFHPAALTDTLARLKLGGRTRFRGR